LSTRLDPADPTPSPCRRVRSSRGAPSKDFGRSSEGSRGDRLTSRRHAQQRGPAVHHVRGLNCGVRRKGSRPWTLRHRGCLVQPYPIGVQTSLWSAAGAGRASPSRREAAFLSGAQRRAGTGRGRPTTRRAKGPSVSSSSASRFRWRWPNRATSTNGANCSNSSARVLPRVESTPGTYLPRACHQPPGRRHRASDPRAVILPSALPCRPRSSPCCC